MLWNKDLSLLVNGGMKTKFNRHKFLALTIVAVPFLTSASPLMAKQGVVGKRSVKGGSWVDLQVSTNKLLYTAGEPIQVKLNATNIQEKDAYLKFSSGQRYDFRVFKVGEKESIYTWSANKLFAQINSTVKLKLAQRETYNTEIGSEMGQLPAGKYRLEAHLVNSSRVRALPIEFTIASAPTKGIEPKVTLTASTDKHVYKVGEEVKVNFSLRNNATKATTFTFRSGQNYDVFIKNAAGESIWNWSANKRFLMVSLPITFAAGEKRAFSVEWDGQALPDNKLTPGTYTVQVVYASDPEIAAAPITIEIR
ncbi:hypothetical protein EON83_01785 [bacterium]|nr:MAG: hypothetical protein EON83_01785 [bacterium]